MSNETRKGYVFVRVSCRMGRQFSPGRLFMRTEMFREEGHQSGWNKILYIKQPYPDNYVDRKLFLRELKKNVTVKLYNYHDLVRNSVAITQQLSSVVVFVAFFCFIHRDWINVTQLIFLANSISVIFYLAWLWHIKRQKDAIRKAAGKQSGKSGVLFMMTLLGLTPILKTLTQDISSDSIWMLSSLCLLVNLGFFDYSSALPTISDSLSLNAAIFASVMFASRLPTKPHVFGFLSIAVDWFALFPLLRRLIRARLRKLDTPLTIVLVSLATLMLTLLFLWLAIVFLIVIGIITFALPGIYVRLQKYKNEIHGPWDEALVRLNKK